MSRLGYAIGLVFAIPVFILVANFLFFRGNNPDEKEVLQFIHESKLDTIVMPQSATIVSKQYIRGLSRRGRPSGFLTGYNYFDSEYKKYFCLTNFDMFDKNYVMRTWVLQRNEDGDKISVRINKKMLNDPGYGTRENPVPVFPIDLVNAKGETQFKYFHVSEELNEIFVEQYLKHIMTKEEFRKMFNK